MERFFAFAKFGTIPEIALELQGRLRFVRNVIETGKIGFDEGLQQGFIGACFLSSFMTLLLYSFWNCSQNFSMPMLWIRLLDSFAAGFSRFTGRFSSSGTLFSGEFSDSSSNFYMLRRVGRGYVNMNIAQALRIVFARRSAAATADRCSANNALSSSAVSGSMRS